LQLGFFCQFGGEAKMKLKWLGFSIALLASLAVTTVADAANSFIRVSGCTYPVLPNCTGITSGGTNYVLFRANDKVPPIPGWGVDITAYGTAGGVSNCGRTPVRVLTWKNNGGVCPFFFPFFQ
jgi:hypothetical protein